MKQMTIDDVIVIELNNADLYDIINGDGLDFEYLGERAKIVREKEKN